MTKKTTASLTTTMIPLIKALSRMPRTKMKVMIREIATAGRSRIEPVETISPPLAISKGAFVRAVGI